MKRNLLALVCSMGLAAACGNDVNMMMTGDTDHTTAEGMEYKFVASALIVPQMKSDFAIDLNGDAKPDNQLGNVIGALASQMLDTQGGIDMAVAAGNAIVLASYQSTDPTLKTAANPGATVYLGKSMMMPDYTGAGMFMVDTAQAPAKFFGTLANGKFSSNNPATTKVPVSVTIGLPLIPGGAPVPLKLNGAHIQIQNANCPANPTTGKTPMMCGQLHGSIKNSDIQTTIIPAVASLLSTQVMNNPMSSSSKQILNIFDVGNGNGGNCTNPDNTMGVPMDGKISTCEVAGNALVGNLLVPDIQVFDSAGSYAPNKTNTMKDSLSLGIGFELAVAKF